MENFSLRTQLLSLSNHSSKVIIPMYNHGCFQRALLFQVVLRDEISDPTFNLRNFLQRCLGFGCRRQQKHHTAAPPPAAVRRRMERERQKLVGRDKGSLTEQQTEGNRNNNDTDKEKTRQNQTRSPEQHRRRTLPSGEWAPAAPTGTQRDTTGYGIPGSVWPGGVSPPGCAPSWSPVKVNPVLAEPRTPGHIASQGDDVTTAWEELSVRRCILAASAFREASGKSLMVAGREVLLPPHLNGGVPGPFWGAFLLQSIPALPTPPGCSKSCLHFWMTPRLTRSWQLPGVQMGERSLQKYKVTSAGWSQNTDPAPGRSTPLCTPGDFTIPDAAWWERGNPTSEAGSRLKAAFLAWVGILPWAGGGKLTPGELLLGAAVTLSEGFPCRVQTPPSPLLLSWFFQALPRFLLHASIDTRIFWCILR